jgi:hypothetical protein
MEEGYQYYIQLFILCYLVSNISNSLMKHGKKKKTFIVHSFWWILLRNASIFTLLYYGGMSFDIF